MTVYRITRKQAFNRYMLLSLVPGCFCSASLQPFFLQSEGGSLLLGLVAMPVPFVILAVYLVSRTIRPVTLKEDERTTSSLLSVMALVGILIAVVALIRMTPIYSDLVTSKIAYYMSQYPEVSYVTAIWFGGFLSGWEALVLGYLVVIQHKRRQNK